MGRMSELHAEQAPQRADAAESELAWTRHQVRQVINALRHTIETESRFDAFARKLESHVDDLSKIVGPAPEDEAAPF